MSQIWKYKGLFATKGDALSVLNGSTDSLALVGNTLYFYEDGALKEFLKDCHYKGDYASIDDVFEKYQYGCVSADFISISGDVYFWNADLNGWSANSSLAVEEGQRIAAEAQAALPETVATTLTRFCGIFTSLDDATYLLSKDGAAGDFIAYKGDLYTWDATKKALSVYPASIHYRGTYDDMQTVETVFPTGGVRGHYVVIDGKAYVWNADKVRWVYGENDADVLEGKDVYLIDRDVHVKGSEKVDGNLEVGRNSTIDGDETVKGNLNVNGKATLPDAVLPQYDERIQDLINELKNLISDFSNSNKGIAGSLADKLSRVNDDTAEGLIKFAEGLESIKIASLKEGATFGSFIQGLLGKGGKIDGEGHAELRSLRLWGALEVPELRYNRISVYTGIRWDTFGGGIIESVTPDPSGAETGTCTLKLEDGEYGAIGVGDLCMGIWHDTTGNATEAKDDNKGNFLFRGFKTVYFQITGVGGTNNNTFTYVLRSSADGGNGIHPFAYMHFAGRGNINNKARQSFTYTTTQYSLSLTGVQTWEFQPENYYFLSGHLDGFSMPAVDSNGKKYTKTFKGYGVVVGNAYIFGQIDQFERAAYRMMIDQSLNGSMQPGETETVTCTIYDGYNKDVTSEFTVWTVKRNSGDSGSDAVWNASHTNVGNPFKLAFTDLGLDGISKFVATFTVTATDEKTDAQAKQLIDFYS